MLILQIIIKNSAANKERKRIDGSSKVVSDKQVKSGYATNKIRMKNEEENSNAKEHKFLAVKKISERMEVKPKKKPEKKNKPNHDTITRKEDISVENYTGENKYAKDCTSTETFMRIEGEFPVD